jgi:hypothetical protein
LLDLLIDILPHHCDSVFDYVGKLPVVYIPVRYISYTIALPVDLWSRSEGVLRLSTLERLGRSFLLVDVSRGVCQILSVHHEEYSRLEGMMIN